MLQHSELSLGPAQLSLYYQRCLKKWNLLVVCSGTLVSSDWFQQCPQCCCLALLSWAIVSFAACSLTEEKTCKVNTAGGLPWEAGWQLTLPGSLAPRHLLVEFAASCYIFISLGGGFVLADTYKKRSGAWICVKESAGEVSCHVIVTSRRITWGKRLFFYTCSGLRASELRKVTTGGLRFLSRAHKAFGFNPAVFPVQCLCAGDTKCFQPWSARGSEETREHGEDSSVKIKRSLYDLFYRLWKPYFFL